MKQLLIGAAVVALAVAPLAAQGNGHGKGQSGGKAEHGPTMQAPSMHGPSMKGPSMKGPSMKGPSMKGPSMKASGHGKSGHAPGSMAPAMKPAAPQHGNGNVHAQGNGGGNARGPARAMAERGRPPAAHIDHPSRPLPPGNGKGTGAKQNAAKVTEPGVKVLEDGRRYYTERGARQSFDFAAVRLGRIDGCPPGLAKKNNGCMPPGLARQRRYEPAWWGLSGLASGPYVYEDGYLLGLNGDRVAGYVPLLGGALSPGNLWPSMYAPVAVPEYYVDYYDLGTPGGYRYADDVLYLVDPSTSAITSIAALLTGDNFQIGSPIPAGYDVYNVPYPYRSQYVDGPDARYRYSDGYIYQVDPTTQLVTAAIDLLVG
jgi:hypothetical protein